VKVVKRYHHARDQQARKKNSSKSEKLASVHASRKAGSHGECDLVGTNPIAKSGHTTASLKRCRYE
jgi:hypothetical protein